MVKVVDTGTARGIRENRLEDPLVLEDVERIFAKRRAAVIRMPAPGSPVVACLSGGMDTVANTAILMQEFGLKVYPFFIDRGQTNYTWEKAAVDYFDAYFKERYPELYHACREIRLDTPPAAYKDQLRRTKESADNPTFRGSVAYPARNPIIALTGMEYAYALQAEGVFAKTVFAVHTADDPVRHSTLTAIRIDNLLMCQIMGDYNWQFISLPIEKELGNYYGKEVMAGWCVENGIPIERSRSCYKDDPVHCGECFPACVHRKEAFRKAGVEDKTVYKH